VNWRAVVSDYFEVLIISLPAALINMRGILISRAEMVDEIIFFAYLESGSFRGGIRCKTVGLRLDKLFACLNLRVSSIAIDQLRVVLCGVSPLVWRRLLVVSTTSIAQTSSPTAFMPSAGPTGSRWQRPDDPGLGANRIDADVSDQ
jgi:hypothetical protein